MVKVKAKKVSTAIASQQVLADWQQELETLKNPPTRQPVQHASSSPPPSSSSSSSPVPSPTRDDWYYNSQDDMFASSSAQPPLSAPPEPLAASTPQADVLPMSQSVPLVEPLPIRPRIPFRPSQLANTTPVSTQRIQVGDGLYISKEKFSRFLKESEKAPLRLATMLYDFLSDYVPAPHKREDIRLEVAALVLANCDVHHVFGRFTADSYHNCKKKRAKYAAKKNSIENH